MLYTNGNPETVFTGLLDTLHRLGVDDKTLEIAKVYLDTAKPMDNSLLEDIVPQDFCGRLGYPERSELAKTVQREIFRHQDEDLLDRYVLLMHAIGGSTGRILCVFPQGETDEVQLLRALQKRFPSEDADAVALAMQSEQLTANSAYGLIRSSGYSPELMYRAMQYCTSNYPKAKLFLCTKLLCSMPLPEKKKDLTQFFVRKQPQPLLEGTLAVLEKCWEEQVQLTKDSQCADYLMLATTAAIYYDPMMYKRFEKNIGKFIHRISGIALYLTDCAERVFSAISVNAPDAKYIGRVAEWTYIKNPAMRDEVQLHALAKYHAEDYLKVMETIDHPQIAVLMERVYCEVDPDYRTAPKTDLRRKWQENCIARYCADYFPNEHAVLSAYLNGETGLDTILAVADRLEMPKYNWRQKNIDYIAAFGMDAFAERLVCLQAAIPNGLNYYGTNLSGFTVHHHEKELLTILQEGGMPFSLIFRCVGMHLESAPDFNGALKEMRAQFCTLFRSMLPEVAACDTKTLNVMGRSLCLELLSASPEEYKAQILALADDTSKVIRAELAAFLVQHPEWMQDILALLSAKKAAKRELALTALSQMDLSAHHDVLQAAFDAEKKAELKQKLAALLGTECPAEAAAESADSLIKELTKGNKAKKVSWLFTADFRPVRQADGTNAETDHLQAILLCYANMSIPGVNPTAMQLAQQLHADDLADFALEVLGRWLEQGAPAKQKWVLYFAALHGGSEAQTTLLHYIKEWSEHARGVIASDAVRAIAFKGTSGALMAVDTMARKFKNRQVRSAAAAALDQAAEELGITTEELADRIVPNLGFDEQLCREFDYGTRQFRVYLTPALELEIYEGEKKLKNLPKPGAKDEPEKAEAASKAFKEMKKQLKTVLNAQKQRLEYVLLCDRTWTAQGWQELFVKNPVMHCFAIGLIWGTYNAEGALLTTFRYMEDGSFNTADEDEYELPEDAIIGLVHPVELDEDTLSAWKEQLSDYEITQPFPQLERPVFAVNPEERGKTALYRFAGKEINNLSLLGRMQKYGWEKGTPQDAGFFYEFERTDVIRREKDAEGRLQNTGNFTELKFSGTCVAVYDSEDVTIEHAAFYAIGSREPLALEQVNRRYFSEIMLQLTAAFGSEPLEES